MYCNGLGRGESLIIAIFLGSAHKLANAMHKVVLSSRRRKGMMGSAACLASTTTNATDEMANATKKGQTKGLPQDFSSLALNVTPNKRDETAMRSVNDPR